MFVKGIYHHQVDLTEDTRRNMLPFLRYKYIQEVTVKNNILGKMIKQMKTKKINFTNQQNNRT